MSISKMVSAPKKGELAWWLDAHRRYFARQAAREWFELDDDILTVLDRFEMVEIDATGLGRVRPPRRRSAPSRYAGDGLCGVQGGERV